MIERKVIFIGQAPGKTGNPGLPLAGGKVGKRMQKLLRVPQSMWIKFDRVNLNQGFLGKCGRGDKFDRQEGRETAAKLLQGDWTHYVLLGGHVARCFGFLYCPLSIYEKNGKRFFICPHPSGLNKWWNNPSLVKKTSTRLRDFVYDKF
jgi:uracil-DNA glycosylase